jgi:hypothetical protein
MSLTVIMARIVKIVIIVFSKIRSLGQFRFRIYFLKLMNLLHSWQDSLDVVSARRQASIYTQENFFLSFLLSFLLLSLAPQPSLGLGLLHKIRLNFLEASQQFSFLQGRIDSPMPNPHPGGPGLCIYIPQRQGDYLF